MKAHSSLECAVRFGNNYIVHLSSTNNLDDENKTLQFHLVRLQELNITCAWKNRIKTKKNRHIDLQI